MPHGTVAPYLMAAQAERRDIPHRYLRRMVECWPLPDTSPMFKRIATGALWFLTIGWGFTFLNLVLGAPSVLGLALAAAGGMFVAMDPLNLFWSTRTDRYARTERNAALHATGAMQTQV